MAVKPYGEESGKKKQVRQMFDKIAHKYDFLNHFLSLGIDHSWRRKAIRELKDLKPKNILDVATGTGDLAIEALRQFPTAQITGIDIAHEMLEVGRKKLKKKGLDNSITLVLGDGEIIDFQDNTFDAITVAFGVRNFENLEKGLEDMLRVLKPGGKAIILEFTKPRSFPFKQLYNTYFKFVLPLIGRITSKDKHAYTYLYESVQNFPDYEKFEQKLIDTGYRSPYFKTLSLGICAIYSAEKV